jgi:hypothetical protein
VPGGSLTDPLDYPWTDGVDLAAPGPRIGRAVVAVGSNAVPAVLRAKFARHEVNTRVAVDALRLDGIAVGHSAHVSVRGYVPAAPYAAPGRCAEVHVSWLDDDQLAALDATEPNYERQPVGGVDLYVSRWGVLAVSGMPVEFTSQREIHAVLAANGAGYDVVDPTDPPGTLVRLQQPDVRDRLRRLWAADGYAMNSGLPELGFH